jgi:hypothetical protein
MKKISLLFSIYLISIFGHAEEGMLIPSLIEAFQSDMKAKGMKLTPDQIYSINHSSLKDAVIHFGGGCTAEIISNQGLILTNHHCGYSQIQQHSSLEKDYLKNGFWAKNFSEELANPGLTASRIVSIEDVTKTVMFGTEGLGRLEKFQKIAENIQKIIKDKTTNNEYQVDIQDFDYGNSYYCMTSEVFQDVRLVGTPPNSIGKFGGDTDNWVWPRHTGDFSVFRIYVGPNNKPAPYSKDNVPYKPLHSLTIDAGKKKNGDFTMVYGFPGLTEQHLVSGQLKYIIDKIRPAQISMREKSLSIIDSRMRASDEIRIKYAAKQASIANSYKKWIGQIQGLRELRAVDVKLKYEASYTQKALENEQWRDGYGTIMEKMNQLFEQNKELEFANAMYTEYLFVGAEFFKQARGLFDLMNAYEKLEKSGELKAKIEKSKKGLDKFYKDYSAQVDQTIFNLLHSEFISQMNNNNLPQEIFKYSTEEWSNLIYSKSILTSKEKMLEFYNKLSSKSIKKLKKDPGFQLYSAMINHFRGQITPKLQEFQITMDEYLQEYVAGKQTMYPNDKHWPDANSTLRITYGKLEGSSPKDGMIYEDHTTIDGIMEKNKTGNPDFELLPRMFELYNKKEFGNYAQDGELWVCFSASNHTTGGNSGSPVINENGQLIGINFDRTWESTMSDYMFSPSRCRNVVCDIRYVLWVIDVYSGASNLIQEMNIIRD